MHFLSLKVRQIVFSNTTQHNTKQLDENANRSRNSRTMASGQRRQYRQNQASVCASLCAFIAQLILSEQASQSVSVRHSNWSKGLTADARATSAEAKPRICNLQLWCTTVMCGVCLLTNKLVLPGEQRPKIRHIQWQILWNAPRCSLSYWLICYQLLTIAYINVLLLS